MKKILLETSFSKIYMIVMILISILVVGGYFSYAMFTVTKEKSNAISIVTGNLYYKLEVDGKESDTITVEKGMTKEVVITLSNPNNRIARFNFYYIGDIPSDVEVGYVNEEGINIPPVETGINLEKIDTAGSNNTYKIRVMNDSNSNVTITLGASVGLDYNDLSLPSDGHLFEEYPFPTAVEVVKSKSNKESLRYMDATEEQRKEAWEHTHPITEQTEALTDYRYIGADPNNYVTFNNETWRIIGVFTVDDGTGKKEERLKIIRNESIGNMAWNSNDINDWSNATLNANLNSGDYWTNILSDNAKSMIGDTLWYLGGTSNYTSSTNGLTSHFYSYERGTTVYSGRDTSWVGKVGLMYPSDYGYATSGGSTKDRNACLNKELYNWDSSSYSDCKNNDWLYESSYLQWTITHRASSSNRVFDVSSAGYLPNIYARNANGVRPVVFLKSNIKIVDGDGSKETPYTLVP